MGKPKKLQRHLNYKKIVTLFYLPYIKKMSSLTKKEKFNKLPNDLNIKLIKGTKNFILYMKDYINNGENLNKNQFFECYLILDMQIIVSSDVEMNKYKLLGTELKKIVDASKHLDIPHFSGLFKQLKEEGKLKSDNTDDELLKYIKLNKTKLSYMMIKEFKDSLTDLKTILSHRKNRDNQRARNRTNKRSNKKQLKE